MGSDQCCRPVVPQQISVSALYERGSIITAQHYSNELLSFKQRINRINELAEIEYYLKQIKQSKVYLVKIMEQFSNIQVFIDDVTEEKEKQCKVVVGSKAYEMDHRYNSIDNCNQDFQHCLFIPNQPKYRNQVTEYASYSTKLKQLRLQKTIEEYQTEEYLSQLSGEIKSYPPLKDNIWWLTLHNTIEKTRGHLLYNFERFIHIINSQLGNCDIVAVAGIRFLYHFIKNHLCRKKLQFLGQQYRCHCRVKKQLSHFYKRGGQLMFTNFVQFKPEKDTATAIEQSQDEKLEVDFITRPFKESSCLHRLISDGKLYYLPLSLFTIVEIREVSKKSFEIYVRQNQHQPLIKETQKICFMGSSRSINHVSINQDNLINQLQALRGKIQNDIEQNLEAVKAKLIRNPDEVQSQQQANKWKEQKKYLDEANNYYEDYKVEVRTEEQIHLNSSFAKVKSTDIKQLPVSHQKHYKQSEPEFIHLPESTIEKSQKILVEYIEGNRFLAKLQKQLFSVDYFFLLTKLDLGCCRIKKIEHMSLFPNLKELYLYSNLIEKIEGIEDLKYLRTLSLSRNSIQKLQKIEHMTHLRSLHITRNQLRYDSALYLSKLDLPFLEKLSISFTDVNNDDNECFHCLLSCKWKHIKQLYINGAQNITNRNQKKLKQHFNRALIQYFNW